MILASRITCRSTESWEALRNSVTLRNSAGIARTTITPDCGLTTTLRPPSVPTMVLRAVVSSAQKSLLDTVETRLLSTVVAAVVPPDVPVVPVVPDTTGAPDTPVPGTPVPGEPPLEKPENTRVV